MLYQCYGAAKAVRPGGVEQEATASRIATGRELSTRMETERSVIDDILKRIADDGAIQLEPVHVYWTMWEPGPPGQPGKWVRLPDTW